MCLVALAASLVNRTAGLEHCEGLRPIRDVASRLAETYATASGESGSGCDGSSPGGRNRQITEFAWFRRDLPWLGPGFIHCVHADAESVLREQLAGLAFTVFTIAGEAVADAHSLHIELARTFDFPDYYGANWDAFNDCFDDPELPHRSALLWRGAERLADSDLKAFAEAVVVFHRAANTVGRDGRQLELFLLGRRDGFRRPGDPVDAAWRQLPL